MNYGVCWRRAALLCLKECWYTRINKDRFLLPAQLLSILSRCFSRDRWLQVVCPSFPQLDLVWQFHLNY